jgi:hypothetical protein
MSLEIEIVSALVKNVIDYDNNPFRKIIDFIPALRKREEEKKEKQKKEILELLKEISQIGISIETYDKYIENSSDRKMKQKYGALFLLFMVFFTICSYLLIILNSILNWNISEYAIIGLVIEIPVQLLGILFIIAKNLFPNKEVK